MSIRAVLAALAALALAGCAAAPKSGPTGEAVRAAAADPAETSFPYAFATLTPDVLDTIEALRRAPPPDDLTDQPSAAAQRFRVGDVVRVTIWEAVEGGLFSGGAESPRASSLPVQRVSPDGRIDVPYAGRVRAAGRTPAQVSAAVEGALAGQAIEPQVLVTLETSPVSSVTVIGAVGQSGRVPLFDVGERVLDVIASAGGTRASPYAATVRLTRGDATAETSLARVLREPGQNVRVRPGDVVAVLDDGRGYSVLGAAGRPSRVAFAAEAVTLETALAEAGGLDDRRSDPASVFVFRYEPQELAEALAGGPQPGPMAPVVYNLDLSDPGAFFLARRFEVQADDIVYLANAPLADAQKVLNAVATGLSPAIATLRLVNALD
ncbi:MAG: polysaccharide biosynthesis/export family protein [Pseudomonadota bacterium]